VTYVNPCWKSFHTTNFDCTPYFTGSRRIWCQPHYHSLVVTFVLSKVVISLHYLFCHLWNHYRWHRPV